MGNVGKHFDPGSLVVIVITLVLFVAAALAKGLTHDLLLEAGVFLVSVKLIVMTYKNGTIADDLRRRLDTIDATLRRIERVKSGEPPA